MDRAPLFTAGVLLAASLAGCISGSEPGSIPAVVEEPEVLLQGRDSFVTSPTTFVARNESSWASQLEDLWTTYHDEDRSMPDVPAVVNFSDKMAIAHFAGETDGVCQGVEIENVTSVQGDLTDADRELIVHVERFRVVSSNLTCESSSPVQMVTVPEMPGRLVTIVHNETYTSPPSGWTEEFSSNGSVAEERSGEGISRESHAGGPGDDRDRVPHETVDYGSDSGITEGRDVAVRNQSQWRDLWQEHTREDRPLPQIDFQHRMILAAFSGPAPSGCHHVEIEQVVLGPDGSNLTAHVQEDVLEDSRCDEQTSYPFHIVKLDRFDGGVAFEWGR